MGLYTGANKAFSTAPRHPVPATLGKISTDVFLKQCFSYQSVYLPSLHDHGEVIETCMTGSCEYSSSRKLIWLMTSHKYCSKLKNHHFASPFCCPFPLPLPPVSESHGKSGDEFHPPSCYECDQVLGRTREGQQKAWLITVPKHGGRSSARKRVVSLRRLSVRTDH